jgi:tryptophan halogenase
MKIVIVGGGTAGWLASLFLAEKNVRQDGYTPYDITVIESPKIGIIGAGEGSTGLMVETIQKKLKKLKGIDNISFLKSSNSTIKLGLLCKDWNGVGTEYFEPLQITKTNNGVIDLHLLSAIKYALPHDATPNGHLWEKNKVPFLKRIENSVGGYAYHFDAYKVGEYFKKVALQNGVKHIEGEVTNLDINPNTGELEGVDLEGTNETIVADFWIDASGFNKILINPMGGDWESYSEHLLCDRAMPYLHPYEENEQIRPQTLAWAMPNGWMWQIPTQERYGCGYVYSSKFVSDEQALKEMKEITGREINPLKIIKFEPGRAKRAWVKNVLAVGLAGSFLEPLEATSIHSTIVQMDMFCYFHLSTEKEVMMFDKSLEKYNKHFCQMLDEYRDLIQMHYMGKRNDTPFWKHMTENVKKAPLVDDMLEICKYRSPNSSDFPSYHGTAGWGVWAWILAGLGHITEKLAHQTLFDFGASYKDDEMFAKLYHQYADQTVDYMGHNEFLEEIKKYKTGPFDDVIVINNFFENPDIVRDIALDFEYESHKNHEGGWRGWRGRIDKQKYGELCAYIQKRISMMNPRLNDLDYRFNFHYCLESTKNECFPSFEETKLHKDPDAWAGVIYLNPVVNETGGTVLYSDDKTQKKYVEYLYNRLVFYPSDILHGPNDLFGSDITNSRLTLTIFANRK